MNNFIIVKEIEREKANYENEIDRREMWLIRALQWIHEKIGQPSSKFIKHFVNEFILGVPRKNLSMNLK